MAAWFIVFAFDQVYIKFAVDNVKLTPWGRSYYTNLLAVGPVFVLGLLTREHEILTDFEWSTASIFALKRVIVSGGFDVVFAIFVERVDFGDKFYSSWNYV